MGEIRLHAISIHQIRDMFGADAELAGRLRQIAADAFAQPIERRRPPLWQRLGPLSRHDPYQVRLPSDWPLAQDWETLIAGRYVEPGRLLACWHVLDAWIDELDLGTHTMHLDRSQTDAFDFATAVAGLPAAFGVRQLSAGDPAIGLPPASGMRVGYSRLDHVLDTAAALGQVADQVAEPFTEQARTLAQFLANFGPWSEQARAAGALDPDLFVVYRERPRSVSPQV